MGYGEPTSQRELTEAKAYSRSRIAMERAEARRKAGLPSERVATRRTVAPQQSGDDYRAWYEEAMAEANAAGYGPCTPADAIRGLDATLKAVRKVRDDYASQARFADVDQAAYFREFVRRLDAALQN